MKRKFRVGDEVRLKMSGVLYIVQSVDPIIDLTGHIKNFKGAIGVTLKGDSSYWGWDYIRSWELVKAVHIPKEQLLFGFMYD